MMMRTLCSIFGVAILFAVAGCGRERSAYQPQPVPELPPAEVAPGQEATLFPLARGNKWVFDMNGETTTPNGRALTSAEVTFEVTNVTDVNNGREATLKVTTVSPNGETRSHTQRWRVDREGIFQIIGGERGVQFEPPQPLARFPIDTSRTWEFEGTGPTPIGNSGKQSGRLTVVGPQEVDTQAGRLSAIAVQTIGDWESTQNGERVVGRFSNMVWLAPNIGFVRVRQELVTGRTSAFQVLRLKEYSVDGA